MDMASQAASAAAARSASSSACRPATCRADASSAAAARAAVVVVVVVIEESAAKSLRLARVTRAGPGAVPQSGHGSSAAAEGCESSPAMAGEERGGGVGEGRWEGGVVGVGARGMVAVVKARRGKEEGRAARRAETEA
jgi:hypothetical protein